LKKNLGVRDKTMAFPLKNKTIAVLGGLSLLAQLGNGEILAWSTLSSDLFWNATR